MHNPVARAARALARDYSNQSHSRAACVSTWLGEARLGEARDSPNQVLTHAATLWPRAARAKGPGQGKRGTLHVSEATVRILSRARAQIYWFSKANWCTNFNCSLGLGFGDGLGLWLSNSGHLLLSGDGLGLGFWVMVLE